MKLSKAFPTAVVGGGPVGLVTALQLGQRGNTLLVVDRAPESTMPPRVEAVPAQFLATLIELGVHPRRIGVDCVHETRLIAWDQTTPREVRGAPSVHLERPALDGELLELIRRQTRISVVIAQSRPEYRDGMWHGEQWSARRLLDATGRRAMFAGRRYRPPKPWIARTYWRSHAARPAERILRISSRPFGYVYRLSSARFLTLGVVGRGALFRGPADRLVESTIGRTSPSMFDDGLGTEHLSESGAFPASVQWTESCAALPLGDAALARDILASQGLAAGTTEAFYAAAIHDQDDDALLQVRQSEQRATHLASLLGQVRQCRFSHAPNWQDYASFLRKHCAATPPRKRVALRDGSLRIVLGSMI